MKVRIDALDVTVLRGGAAEVGRWANEHGFRLPPDAPEVLDFYADRSPIFLAAVFDADAAAERGQAVGDGTPVHVTIPTDNPWVPLRILALGKTAAERVDADVYLLTDRRPALLPAPIAENGLGLGPQRAGDGLAARRPSLRHGMGWVPDVRLADQGHDRCGRVAISPSTSRSTRRVPVRRRGSWPAWTCRARRPTPGSQPATSGRLGVGLAFTIGGIGGILVLAPAASAAVAG